MNIFKTLFLKQKNKNILKKHAPRRETLTYSKTRHIGLIIEYSKALQAPFLSQFLQILKEDHKEVQVWIYKKKPKLEYDWDYPSFSQKDINLWGNFTLPSLNEFLQTSFDYLFCIRSQPYIIFDTFLIRSHAKCRIGNYSPEPYPHLEMMISENIEKPVKESENIDVLLQLMLKYTKETLIYP